jgi:hypothetical protein
MRTQKQRGIGDSFRGLMAAVINRALADIAGGKAIITASGRIRDEAMAWINGSECEAFCLALDIGCQAVREKAAALCRRFLEKAESGEKASRKPRKRPGHWFFVIGRESPKAAQQEGSTGILEKVTAPVFG